MHASTVFFALAAFKGVMASPVEGPELEARGASRGSAKAPGNTNIPSNLFPSFGGGGCSSNSQSNQCSNGNPYCCSSDGNGGHICSNTTACSQTVICCNNNNGFQLCIGNLDFTLPITINVYE